MTGGGPETAPVVDATCDGGGEETGGGSNGVPPLPPAPSPALKPREKSLGAAGGTAEVGAVGRPVAGPLNPDLSEPADGAPPDIPPEGIPVDGKFSPLDDPPDIGSEGAEVGAVREGGGAIGSGLGPGWNPPASASGEPLPAGLPFAPDI